MTAELASSGFHQDLHSVPSRGAAQTAAMDVWSTDRVFEECCTRMWREETWRSTRQWMLKFHGHPGSLFWNYSILKALALWACDERRGTDNLWKPFKVIPSLLWWIGSGFFCAYWSPYQMVTWPHPWHSLPNIPFYSLHVQADKFPNTYILFPFNYTFCLKIISHFWNFAISNQGSHASPSTFWLGIASARYPSECSRILPSTKP